MDWYYHLGWFVAALLYVLGGFLAIFISAVMPEYQWRYRIAAVLLWPFVVIVFVVATIYTRLGRKRE